jgi:hypothetical protein
VTSRGAGTAVQSDDRPKPFATPGPGTTLSATVCRLGFWVAIVTVVLSATALVIGFVTPVRGGPFCPSNCIAYPYVDAGSFFPEDYIWIVPGFLLVPTFVVLMACIDAYAPYGRKLFGRLALSFALVYAPIVAIDYFIQFTVIAPSLRSGQTEGLSLFTMYNPHGLFVALESLGYLAMAVAFLFAAPVFEGGRVERSIRWIFVAGFILAVGMFLGLSFSGSDIVGFEVAVLSIDWIVLIVTGVLLAVVFSRATRPASSRLGDATSG